METRFVIQMPILRECWNYASRWIRAPAVMKSEDAFVCARFKTLKASDSLSRAGRRGRVEIDSALGAFALAMGDRWIRIQSRMRTIMLDVAIVLQIVDFAYHLFVISISCMRSGKLC
ncbi:hypothetical protein EVAR_79194_1 [Eumeta japonica]|uniref:Uncharacterized protein n=1 Tax=Eumeta variegata TaxID=151549 RepID=A0A4C1UT76_EUMVA|nr:hypothetical protein EVAR_79194_1 [Eumeta japonica]